MLQVLLVGTCPQGQVICDALRREGYDCLLAEGLGEARVALGGSSGSRPQAVLLCGDANGHGQHPLITALRAVDPEIPLLVLSQNDCTDDKVTTLRAGADDYLVLPLEVEELLARLHVSRRRQVATERLVCGALEIDRSSCLVWREGERVRLSMHEQEVLRALIAADGDAVSKVHLLSQVWGLEFDPGTSVVEVLIARLRRRLGPEGPRLIRTVVGVGYQLDVSG